MSFTKTSRAYLTDLSISASPYHALTVDMQLVMDADYVSPFMDLFKLGRPLDILRTWKKEFLCLWCGVPNPIEHVLCSQCGGPRGLLLEK